jgi:RNA polymerase subunit RPABC4/transcription elongation factor Spt4
MYCSDWGFGLGYFGHWPGLILSLLIIFGVGVLFFRLVGNVTGWTRDRSSINSNYISSGKRNNCPNCKAAIEDAYLCCPECNHKLKKNCSSCGKIVKTSWKVCPYCETNL